MLGSASATAWVLVLGMVASGSWVGDEGPGKVSGLVVGADGQPAPGVELIAAGGDWDDQPPALMGRARSDDRGQFMLELNASVCVCDHPTLWAYRPGSVATSIPIDRSALSGLPVRLAMGSPSRSEFVVAGPEGQPVVGARVVPRRLARDGLAVPSALAELTTAITDARGRATLGAFRPEELVAVRVESAEFGVQSRDFRGRDGQAEVGPKGITLMATGRIVGRIIAEDARAVAGLRVLVTTSAGVREALEAGSAEVSTDAAGRFEVPKIAAGAVTVRVLPGADSPDLPGRVVRRNLEPGQSVAVEVPLRRGVRVAGIARDARDGRPIPGALVAVVPSGSAGTSRVWTDAEGRYQAYVPSGLVTHRVLRVPEPYLCPPDFVGPRPVEVPPAIASFELPPIALTRGADLRGSVIDEDSRPVPGARVVASWTMFDGRVRVPMSVPSTSGLDGSFVIGPVDPEVELSLRACSGSESTLEPTTVHASAGGMILLTVVEPDDSSPVGRVVDDEGRPVAGASVRIWAVTSSSGGSILGFDGVDHLRTDAQGRFQGPRRLRRDREYRATADAPGHVPGRTRPIRAGGSTALAFPEIVLAREARRFAVEGRVIDRRGRPLAGVEVHATREGPCYRRALTDLQGRFRLEDLAEGRDFLFAEADGYRFAGRAIETARGPFDLTLTRLDEPSSTSMRTRIPAKVSPALGRSVLAPYVERVLSQGDHATRVRTLELLARVDPRRVLTLIGARGVEDAWFADHLRQVAALGLIDEGAAEEALTTIEAISESQGRALAYLSAVDALPSGDRGLKGEWIERGLRDARTIRDPADRVVALAGVVDRLIELGDAERASRLLADARPLADSLPAATSGGRARAAFAESLARVDPEAALAMTDGLVDPGEFDRSRLNIARSIAVADPTRASAVLGMLRDPRTTAGALPALCHAMARVDPQRARRLIARTRSDDPCLPAYSLGMMALGVADQDKPEATAWLREAFDLLDELASAGPTPPGTPHDPAAVAASLLPVAEKVDPGLVPELFWRALALHRPRPVAEVRSEAIFAMLLGRYAPEVALGLLEPLTERSMTAPGADLEPLVTAAATLDPALAFRLVQDLPEAVDLAFHQPKNVARLALAAALDQPAPACWDLAVTRFLHLWTAETP